MKYKKYVTITLVGLFIATSLSSVVGAKIFDVERGIFKDNGEIVTPLIDSKYSGDFLIRGENGIKFMGVYYNLYKPVNLPDEFKKCGLKVKFTAEINLKSLTSFSGLISIFNKILPIKIISIEQVIEPQPEKTLILELNVKNEYKVEEPIVVSAILTNVAEKYVAVCEMDLELDTLDFFIETPEGYTIHYIGPHIAKLPKVVLLPPGDSITVKIDIKKEGLFGMDRTLNEPYKFIEGPYTIKGYYKSYVPTLTSELLNNMHEFEVNTDLYKFAILS